MITECFIGTVAAGYIDSLQYLNDHLSILDVLTSFAVCTINAPIPYVRPQMLEKGTGSIELLQVRHPCMELQDGVNFIPNDAIFRKGGHEREFKTNPKNPKKKKKFFFFLRKNSTEINQLKKTFSVKVKLIYFFE